MVGAGRVVWAILRPASATFEPIGEASRAAHEQWLRELTSLPTAAGREDAVVAWIDGWVRARPRLTTRRDRAGNVLIGPHARQRRRAGRQQPAPIVITAHLDHPAFVVTGVQGSEVSLEFRGGVHDAYFPGASIEIHDRAGCVHAAEVATVDAGARPFKRVTAWLGRPDASAARASRPAAGDLARWRFDEDEGPRIADGRLYAHACDDLAAVAAALGALDHLALAGAASHVSLLLTRAEEVGFVGAIAACRARSVPAGARLICLEASRSFAESPIGAGPIVRVGDRTSVFDRGLTNAIAMLMAEHEQARASPGFRWQRKLMPGGTCEATAFGAYGYRATCLCLPLGNYHNMVAIDDVLSGNRPAEVGPEFISLDDFHGLVEMLIVCATRLERAPALRTRMEALLREYGHVLTVPAAGRPARSAGRRRR